MSQTATKTSDMVVSGGCRIEIAPDQVSATRSRSAWALGEKWVLRYILTVAGCAFMIFISISNAISRSSHPLLVSAMITIALLAVAWVLALLRGKVNLRCTREYLELTRVRRGRVLRVRSFLRTEVERIQFVDGSFFHSGARGSLGFIASGKKYEVLNCLLSVEAQKIIDECARLGYDVVRDIGMPMMIEMERSRRKSWFFPW
jgi:hypothetical protein